jgi:hypothetical protein
MRNEVFVKSGDSKTFVTTYVSIWKIWLDTTALRQTLLTASENEEGSPWQADTRSVAIVTKRNIFDFED